MHFLCAIVASILLASTVVSHVVYELQTSQLKVGFYRKTCPQAEAIVRKTIRKAISTNPRVAGSFLRMHFHDCFVRGCDGSILLDSKPGMPAEKEHPANNPSLVGYEVIDKAKAKIEALCPATVSCADVLAFAARDSAYFTGISHYSVPAGRRDGRISNVSEPTQNLPPHLFNALQLAMNFAVKGMTMDEMVVLSGAHSLGVTHCTSFANRLYSFNETHPQDPTIDPSFARRLKARCPNRGPQDGTLAPLDYVTPKKLDNVYYKNLIKGRGVLASDQELYSDPLTAKMVKGYARNAEKWESKFIAAMVKMGTIDVKTGKKGEIRCNCRVAN